MSTSLLGEHHSLRARVDMSTRDPVLIFFASAVFWLIAGSILALVASVKMHTPGFLVGAEWLTFGRVRPAHLLTVIYGWGSMAGIGVLLWLQARLAKSRLPFPGLLVAGALVWNLALTGGTAQVLIKGGTSVEWLEFPLWVALCFAAVFLVIMMSSMRLLSQRRTKHLYVSQWYLLGAVLWFPFLYLMGNFLIHQGWVRGVASATTNWWFAHNVLGLWFTPIGLASAYYFIPKVIGRPVYSYYLSIIGFWTLAIFYNWAGSHHLIGGPAPAWIVTVGVVGSMMMLIPVITVAMNHHMTLWGNFDALRTSPTLRFTVFGAVSYTLVSVQGSLTSLRVVNETTHFTHYTVAHAHLGVYAFFSMVMFGAMYYIIPRLTGAEWVSAGLIKAHFWFSGIGILLYWVPLSVGGVFQGLAMNNPEIPFLEVVAQTMPYLFGRSAAGILMTLGHLAFAVLCINQFLVRGRNLVGPTLFTSERSLLDDLANEREEAEAPA